MKTVDFIYDGECPICNYAAHTLRIKESVGTIKLIDARTTPDHPLLAEIKTRKLDLDQGMVIHYAGSYYHGRDALHFMGMIGSGSGWFNRINAVLFNNKKIAFALYPLMRAARNALLRLKGVGKIDNLHNNDEPLFKRVFGDGWKALPPVMKKHYANRAHHDDKTRAIGHLDITASKLGRALFPVFRIMGMLVPRTGNTVKTAVNFTTREDDDGFRFDRQITFADGESYRFLSVMRPVGGNQMVEVMRCQLGWRMAYLWDGHKVLLLHRGYVFNFFGLLIPLPITFLLGKGYAEETPIDEDHFAMMTEIRHPWWGVIYSYKGRFRMEATAP